MPVYLLEWARPQEDTEEKREKLRQEIEGYTEAGAAHRNKVRLFMEENGIWHIKELDYAWRCRFAEEIKRTVKPKYHSVYLKCFDHIKQYDMRKQIRLHISQKNRRYPYEDRLLFLPYHPAQELVERMDAYPERPEWVWDFSRKAPGKMKRQIFDILNHFLKEDQNGKILRRHLRGLWRFYQFCLKAQIEDIEQMGLEQTIDYQKQAKEEGQPRAAGIIDTCRRVLFMQAEEINWDADVWYLERLCLQPERMDPSSPVVSLSFTEVTHGGNRKLLKKYMQYGLGLTDLSLRYLHGEFRGIRSFLKDLEQDAYAMTEGQIRNHFQGLQEQQIQPETFNRRIMSLQHFYQFLQVRKYVNRIPFHADYYLKKTQPQHHDRSVEEKTADEILQKLHQFPETLRMMYLHLWGIGLRISEVCTLKGDAYYIQGRDAWIQVYQIKMKTYKRIPIPAAIYQLMQVYLKKHHIAADSYVFQNIQGGSYQSSTFRSQMIRCCRELEIQGGEYMFRSHDYRHGIATYFYDSGVSIQGVRDYLGHVYEEMTRQYIDYMPDKIDQSSKELFTKPGNSLMARLREGDG